MEKGNGKEDGRMGEKGRKVRRDSWKGGSKSRNRECRRG